MATETNEKERTVEPTGSERATIEAEPIPDLSRRTILKAGAVTASALAASAPAVADDAAETAVDEPDGFKVELLAEHAPFTDGLAASFDLTLADEGGGETDDGDPIAVEVKDASTVLVGEVHWEPGGTSGWHRHPGVVIVNVVEGEIDVTWAHDCVTRTYAVGESFFDPGEVHIADSADGATGYATFLGIPDGEPATEWVEPVEC